MRLDPLREAKPAAPGPRPGAARPADGAAFGDAPRQAVARQSGTTAAPAVEFSKHAQERLEQRGIRLTDDLLGRLNGAVDRAEGKGSQTTLVLIDDTAFVVGVPNRRVVTVADQSMLRERVFTNIDSMVIA
ncbi:MAG: flagellar biosynthesis protein [Armatimonadetes bacterium]|nr:flagellar biosynthesis protein [Armatimonadota bacterium]